jgi:hypothetical protein
MRASRYEEAMSLAAGTSYSERVACKHMTRASLSAQVSSASSLDAALVLQASNEPPTSYLMPYARDTSEASWFDVPGASVGITADGSQVATAELSYEWVRAKVVTAAGTATATVRLDLKSMAN